MSDVPSHLRVRTVTRAANRCEYCKLAQEGQEARFHIDHVIPRNSNGETTEQNLALACVSCSLRKGAKIFAVDPATGEVERIFNPRTQNWHEHFRWNNETLVGLTPTGRTTIQALALNRELILAIRKEETFRGRHPA